VYLRGSKKFVKDTFHVFDRSVRVGQEMSDGHVADCNYVWLSAWQLENINSNFLLPLDLQEYLSLKNDLAKGLLFHLNVWFYASRGAAVEKRYDRLCELLGIKMRTAISLVRQAFDPSMNELIALGYLDSWDVAPIEGFKTEYKIILNPGRRTPSPYTQIAGVVISPHHEQIVKMMVDRGVREKAVRQLLLDVPTDQPVMDQIEYFDHVRMQMAAKLRNPPGLLLSMIRNNDPVPADFLTTTKAEIARRRQAPSRAEREQAEREFQELQLKVEYSDYCEELEREFKETNLSETELLRNQIVKQLRKNRDILSQGEWALHRAIESALRKEILTIVRAPSFEEFKGQKQRSLF
jgi:hypothetical protein